MTLELRRFDHAGNDVCIMRGSIKYLTDHMESIIKANEYSAEFDTIINGLGQLTDRWITKSKYSRTKVYYIVLNTEG